MWIFFQICTNWKYFSILFREILFSKCTFYFSGNMKCLECFLISGATIIMPAHTRSADAKRGLVMPLFPQHYIFLLRLLFGFPIFHFGTATSNAIISPTLHISFQLFTTGARVLILENVKDCTHRICCIPFLVFLLDLTISWPLRQFVVFM